MLFYLKGITKMGDNSDKTKKSGSLFFFFFFFFFFSFFFMRQPYMKFQNISIHGSKLMLCT